MTERGDYRAIHTVLLESPEFVDMSAHAQLIWFHLKLRLGATGIDVIPAAEAVLSEATNLPPEDVRNALFELQGESPSEGIPNPIPEGIPNPPRMGWLMRERNVFWLRNALKFEPSRTLTNDNHRKNVMKHLCGLPKLKVVNDFADYYELVRPFPDLSPPPSPQVSPPPSPQVSPPPSPPKGIPDPLPDHGRTEERNTEERNTEERNTEKEKPPYRGAKRKGPLPGDWEPNATHSEIAGAAGRDLALEAARFRDHALSNGRVQTDWDAAFRNWLRSEYGRPVGNGTGPPDPLDIVNDRANRERWYEIRDELEAKGVDAEAAAKQGLEMLRAEL